MHRISPYRCFSDTASWHCRRSYEHTPGVSWQCINRYTRRSGRTTHVRHGSCSTLFVISAAEMLHCNGTCGRKRTAGLQYNIWSAQMYRSISKYRPYGNISARPASEGMSYAPMNTRTPPYLCGGIIHCVISATCRGNTCLASACGCRQDSVLLRITNHAAAYDMVSFSGMSGASE